MIALVNPVVVDLPPRSAVLYFPSEMVLIIASWIRSALSWSFKWRSIATALSRRAVGFAKSWTHEIKASLKHPFDSTKARRATICIVNKTGRE